MIGSLPLSAEAFEEAAAQAAGLSDFGHPYYREGLECLLHSLKEEVAQTVVGSMMLQRSILLALERRLRLVELRKQKPSFLTEALKPPLIITGLPRSGTTFFHRLMAQDPQFRAPLLHELLQPLPLGDKAHRRLNRLRLAIEIGVFRRMATKLDARHFTRADEPEECMFAMCQSFRSFMFWSLTPVASHVSWYMQQSRLRKYLEYADTLKALQSLEPARRLLLKAPEHLGAIDEILTVMPGAMIVVCRRDPLIALASFNSLIGSTHRASAKRSDPGTIGRVNLDMLAREADRHVKGRGLNPGKVLDLDYALITQDPIAAAKQVYNRFKLQPAPESWQRLQEFAAGNQQAKHGAHHYPIERAPNRQTIVRNRFAAYEATRGSAGSRA